jgi:hypothetical protein
MSQAAGGCYWLLFLLTMGRKFIDPSTVNGFAETTFFSSR